MRLCLPSDPLLLLLLLSIRTTHLTCRTGHPPRLPSPPTTHPRTHTRAPHPPHAGAAAACQARSAAGRIATFHQTWRAGALFWASASLLAGVSATVRLGMLYCVLLHWATFHGLGELVRPLLRARVSSFRRALLSPAPTFPTPSIQLRPEVLLYLLRLCLPLHLMHGFLQALLDGMTPMPIAGSPSFPGSVLALLFLVLPLPLLSSLPWVLLVGVMCKLVLVVVVVDVGLCACLAGVVHPSRTRRP